MQETYKTPVRGGRETERHDEADRAAVAAVAGEDLDLVESHCAAPRNLLDRIVKGATFHD